MNKISIIIPTYNEELIVKEQLTKLFSKLDYDFEVILIDSGSDLTYQIASKFNITILKSKKGRAVQMNKGASVASGDILYFLHLDTDIPIDLLSIIRSEVNRGVKAGCCRMKFDDNHWLMQFYGWCTRLPFTFCRGGDQSLFITKELFNDIGDFDESLSIMEDIDVINRIKKKTSFKILSNNVITSSRKYKSNGRIRLQLLFGAIHLLSAFGMKQRKLLYVYNYIK